MKKTHLKAINHHSQICVRKGKEGEICQRCHCEE